MIEIESVSQAAGRIGGRIHRTPVLRCRAIDEMAGCQLFFKCENLQRTGSFKIRGATNAVALLTPEELKRGVVTHSSGNHAAALAMAARSFGCQAHIVMPSNSSAVKKAAVQTYGGRIVECEPTLEARLSVADEVQQQTGAVLVPPFDHPHIIAGQGTCALELVEQIPNLDSLVAPIGGGGLMSGTAIVGKHLGLDVIGTEPAGADDAFRSKQQNRLVPQTAPDTIADGLRTSLGEWTWPFIRDQVSQIIRVGESEMVTTMKMFWERTKQIIEPSSAVPLAAILGSPDDPAFRNKRVGVILSGGNVDLMSLPWIKIAG